MHQRNALYNTATCIYMHLPECASLRITVVRFVDTSWRQHSSRCQTHATIPRRVAMSVEASGPLQTEDFAAAEWPAALQATHRALSAAL